MFEGRRNLLVADGVFTSDDLDLIVDIAQRLAFEEQDLGRGVIGRRSRAETADVRIPTLLWNRLGPMLPPLTELVPPGPSRPRLDPPLEDWLPVGCNPRTRFYR